MFTGGAIWILTHRHVTPESFDLDTASLVVGFHVSLYASQI